MKYIVNKAIKNLLTFLKSFTFGAYIMDHVLYYTMNGVSKVVHNNTELLFCTPNRLCDYRSKSFSEKEPETLAWINSLEKNSILWDIGANVGLYSVYAAKARDCSVFSFEPSVFNLEILARNIYLNNLTEKIVIVPLPLNNKIGFSNLRMTSTDWGGALSSFDHDLGFDGNKIEQIFEYKLVGIDMDSALNLLNIPQPDYIKMDVDGIEHFILKGGMTVLKNVKSVIIEINDDFNDQATQCSILLENAGLKLVEKKHGQIFEQSNSVFNHCYNQIWKR